MSILPKLFPPTLETPAQPAAPRARGRRWPRLTVDLSQPRHRLILLVTVLASVAAAAAVGYTGYAVYEYTESAEFCGGACHVMGPQHARFESSAHANVPCVECHIGPGADFYVRAKIDGLRQVYAVLAGTFANPIKSPVHNLRPARETCETCHTPTSYQDNVIKTVTHYSSDEANTRVQSTLILKLGGWQQKTGISAGIHWHISNEVYYIAADEQRQVMAWVGIRQPDGSLKEYFARDMLNMDRQAFVEEARAQGEVRQMDCIDCHNRTAHLVPPPTQEVDAALNAGLIPADLPFVRARAVEILTPAYANQAAGLAAAAGLADFYRGQYPDVYANRRAEVDQAVNAVQTLYLENNFPEMGLNWQTNPNNERHTPTAGCFRCHDDKHVNVDAAGNEVQTISVKCNLCHSVPIVGRGDTMLVEAPVIVGQVPPSHSDFRWTIEHRAVDKAQQPECYQCHGQGFCNNGACHNLSHPPEMLYTHAAEYRQTGDQTCYTCHQDVLCSRCHAGTVIQNP